MTEHLRPGTYVIYHGSLGEYHGLRMAVEQSGPPYIPLNDEDTVRYVLRYGLRPEDKLFNVRPTSFSEDPHG